MKKILDCYMRKNQRQERLKGVALGAVVGTAIGMIAGILIKDDEKREKIRESSRKIVREAEKIANEAKRVVVDKASQCCGKRKREIVEVFPDDEE